MQKEDPTVTLDIFITGNANIKFGQRKAISSIGSIWVQIEMEEVIFHVLKAPILFLLCFTDINKLNVYYNNITNELI